MRRSLLQTVSVAALLVVLAAVPAWAVTTIQYQYNWYNNQREGYNEAFEAMIEAFNSSQSDIRVEGFVVSGTDERLITSIAAGIAADVVHFETSSVIDFASRGLLEPLDPVYDYESIERYFFAADAAEVMWNGRVWGLPGYTNVRGLFWNVDILNEVGLDSSKAPETLQGLEELAAKATVVESDGRITRLGFTPWMGGMYPAGWFWAFGGEIYDPETGMPTLTREENIEAWHWVQDWAQRYPEERYDLAAGGLSGANGYFVSGSLAATVAADNTVASYRTAAPDLNFGTGRIPHAPGGRNGTWGGGIGHVIPKGAKHPDEAKIFLRWIATEGQKILYERLGEFPTSMSVAYPIIESLPMDDPRVPLFEMVAERNPRPPLWAPVIRALISAEGTIRRMEDTPRNVLENLQRQYVPEYEKLQR